MSCWISTLEAGITLRGRGISVVLTGVTIVYPVTMSVTSALGSTTLLPVTSCSLSVAAALCAAAISARAWALVALCFAVLANTFFMAATFAAEMIACSRARALLITCYSKWVFRIISGERDQACSSLGLVPRGKPACGHLRTC